jgi:hypothetical protein
MPKQCIFCGEECASKNDDEGCKGKEIGKKMICTGCLTELKEALDSG